MLSDISNINDIGTVRTSPRSEKQSAQTNKRAWSGDDLLLPSKVKAKRALSSSSPAPSSPFGSNRLAAFEAPTSPTSQIKVITSPPPALSSLPPSSPTFELGAREQLEQEQAGRESLLHSNDEPLLLHLERGTVLQFGRKARQRALPFAETSLPIVLPRSAKNASRLHATARIITSEGSSVVVEVRVIGQNGMKINGKRWRAGAVAVLPMQAGTQLTMSFWGWSARVVVAKTEERRANSVSKLARPVASRMSSYASTAEDLASIMDDEELFVGNDDETDLAADVSQVTAPPSPALSALSELSTHENEVDHVKAQKDARTAASLLQERLSLDLAGMIASAIVFSPRSTVGVEEVVRALLRDVGGMWDVLKDGKGSEDQSEEREDAAVEAWWDTVENVLATEPFFGCIDNAGLKDAGGHPLLPVYYYEPDADPSSSRVEALEPFVKRVRGARSKPARYFWAKPSLRRNR